MSQTTLNLIWLRAFGTADRSAPVMLALPHAGGSARQFSDLAKELLPAVDLQGVQYPGRQDRFHDRFAASVDELADELADVVTSLARDGRRVTLLGHSLGAIVAFEVARRTDGHLGAPLAALVVSGRPAPSGLSPSAVHALDDEAFVAELTRVGGAGTDALADPELRSLLLPMLRADFTLAETYHYRDGPPLSCPVLAVCGDADPTMAPGEMALWARHTRGPFSMTTLPGGHFYFEDDPAALAARISEFVPRP